MIMFYDFFCVIYLFVKCYFAAIGFTCASKAIFYGCLCKIRLLYMCKIAAGPYVCTTLFYVTMLAKHSAAPLKFGNR